MKLDTQVAQVEGNMTFQKTTRMGFDEESHVYLIEVLTNLYSNPELAVLREYPSNGLDSHQLAGITRPIELTMPTSLNPNFIVRDFGVGMSYDELNDIYSRYGASTKRNSNNQIGGFGLGAKSALTISPHFTIISVKDGQRNVVLISKGEDGVGALNFIATDETDEPNGVEITIPIKNVSKFITEAAQFFRGVNPNDMIVDGKRIEDSVYNTEKYSDIDGLGWFKKSALLDTINSSSNVAVKVGPVIYKLDNATQNLFSYNSLVGKNNSGVVIHMNIGEVDLTPSREGLRYSDKTVRNVKLAIEEYEAALKANVIGLFESLETRAEAAQFLINANKKGFDIPYVWHGEVVPDKIEFPDGTFFTANSGNGKKTTTTGIKHITLNDLVGSYNSENRFLVGVTDLAEKDRVFKNLKDFGKANDFTRLSALAYITTAPLDVWIKDITVAKAASEVYETALEYRREVRRNSRTTSVGTGSGVRTSYRTAYLTYDTSNDGDVTKLTADLIQDDVLYVLENDRGLSNVIRQLRTNRGRYGSSYTHFYNILRALLPNRHVAFLPSNISVERFLKLFPEATKLEDTLGEAFTAWFKSLTKAQKAFVKDTIDGQNTSSRAYLTRIASAGRISEVKNRDVRTRIEVLADEQFVAKTSMLTGLNSYEIRGSKPGLATRVAIQDIEDKLKFTSRYPLLDGNSRNKDISVDHIIAYMNLADKLDS